MILRPWLVTVSKLVLFSLSPIFCSSIFLGTRRLLRIGVLVGLVVCGKMKCMGPELIHSGVKSFSGHGDGGYFRRLIGGVVQRKVEASVDVEGEQFGPLVEVWE